jgi:hypothetical protein
MTATLSQCSDLRVALIMRLAHGHNITVLERTACAGEDHVISFAVIENSTQATWKDVAAALDSIARDIAARTRGPIADLSCVSVPLATNTAHVTARFAPTTGACP